MSDAQTPAVPAIDVNKTHQVTELKHGSPLLACRFDPSGQYVFATAFDNTIQRWRLDSPQATPLVGHESWVRALVFDAGGSTLISGGCDGQLIWWPALADAPQPQRTVQAHQGWVRGVALSPDGRLLASCGNDHRVRLWNAADGNKVGECVGHTHHVYSVAFHPDGRRLVSGDLKGVVREWDVDTGEQLRHFDASALWKYDAGFQADIGGVRAMAFCADGTQLACGGITEVTNAFAGVGFPMVVVFDCEKGEKIRDFVSSAKIKAPITGVRFHRDGFLIGSCGGLDGGHLLFWKLEQPNEVFALKLKEVARDVDLHPDALRLATAHGDGFLRVWHMTEKA